MKTGNRHDCGLFRPIGNQFEKIHLSRCLQVLVCVYTTGAILDEVSALKANIFPTCIVPGCFTSFNLH